MNAIAISWRSSRLGATRRRSETRRISQVEMPAAWDVPGSSRAPQRDKRRYKPSVTGSLDAPKCELGQQLGLPGGASASAGSKPTLLLFWVDTEHESALYCWSRNGVIVRRAWARLTVRQQCPSALSLSARTAANFPSDLSDGPGKQQAQRRAARLKPLITTETPAGGRISRRNRRARKGDIE
jgi:hypothetical protein